MKPYSSLTEHGQARRLRPLAWNALQQYPLQVTRLQASGEPMRILHNDLHQWNVRNFRGVLSPIDFEDLMLGWPVQNIATTLYYFPSQNFAALRQAFKEGYIRCSPWPERHRGEINSFIAARGFGLANFVLNDPNPNWKSKAGEFIEGLEKQLRKLLDGVDEFKEE